MKERLCTNSVTSVFDDIKRLEYSHKSTQHDTNRTPSWQLLFSWSALWVLKCGRTLEISQAVDGKYALLSSTYDICLGCAQAGE